MENFKLAKQLISMCCWTSGNLINLNKYVIFGYADGMLAKVLTLLGLIVSDCSDWNFSVGYNL